MDSGDNASASNLENSSISHENGNIKFNVIDMKLKQILEKLERHEQEIYNTKWKESITNEIAKISRKLESSSMDITAGDGDESNPSFASKDMNRAVTNILLNDPSINKLSNDLKAIHAATRRLEGRQNEHAIVVSQVIELQHALEESVTAQADIYKSSEHFIVRKPATPVNRSTNNSGKLTTALQTLLTGFQGTIDELARTVKKQEEMLEASNKVIQNLELSLKNSGTLAMTGNITIRSQLRSAAMLSRVSGQGRKLENFQAQLDSIAAENADNWAQARFSIVTIGLKTLAGVLKKRRRKDIQRGWIRIKQWNKRITNIKLLRVQTCSRLGNIRRHQMLRGEFDTWKRSVYQENAAAIKRQRMLTLLSLLRNRVFWDQRRLYTRWHKHMLLSRARARYVLPSESDAGLPPPSEPHQLMLLPPISEGGGARELPHKGSGNFSQQQQQQLSQPHHSLHRSNTALSRMQSHELMRRGSSYSLLQKQSSANEDTNNNSSDTLDPSGASVGNGHTAGAGAGGGSHNKRGSGFRLDMMIPAITAAPPLMLSELQELLQMGGGIEPCLSFIVSYCQGVGARLQQTIDAHIAATRHMSELTVIVANSGAFNETKLNGRCDKMEDEVYRLETMLQKRLHSLEQEFDSLRDGSNHYSASVDTSLAAVTDRIAKLEGKKGIDVDRIERLMLLQGDFLQRVDKIDLRLSADEVAIAGIKVELLTHVTTFAELSEKYAASRRSWEEGLQFLEGQHHDLKQGERRINSEVVELRGRMDASDRAADELTGHLTKRLRRIEGILASAAPPPPSPSQLVEVFRSLEEEALKSSADGGVSFTKSLAGGEGRRLAFFAHRLANQLSAQADLDVLFGTVAGRRFGEPYGDNIPLAVTGDDLGVEGAALADPVPPEEETLHRREFLLTKFHQEFLIYLEKSFPMPGKLRTEARIMLHKKFLGALDTALSRHIPVSLAPSTSIGRSNAISSANGVACMACDKPLRARSAGRSFAVGGNRLNTEALERNFSVFISRQFEGGGGAAASPPSTPFPTDHTISQELKGYDEMLSKLALDQSRPTSSSANNNNSNNSSNINNTNTANTANNSAAFTNNSDASARPNSAAAAGAGNSRHRVALKDATSYVKRGGFKFPAYSESEELVQSLVQPAGGGLEKAMRVGKEPVKNSTASRRTTSARLTQAGNSALSNGQSVASPLNNFDSSEMTDEVYSPYHQRRLVGYNESAAVAMAGGTDAEAAGRLGSTWSSIISSHQQSAYGTGLAGSESSPAVLSQPTPGYSAVSGSQEGGRGGSASHDADKGGGNKRSRTTKGNTVMNVMSYSGATKANKRQVATVGRGEFAKMIDSNAGATVDVDTSSANLLQQTFDLALYSGTTR